MKAIENLLWILVLLSPILAAACFIAPRRIKMERRAKRLLAQMPRHERRTVYLSFTSPRWSSKGKETDAKIAEEEQAGWTFLKANEANPLKMGFTWAGGVNLHFIRKV